MFEAQCSKKPTIVSRCEGFPVGDKRGSSTKKALKQGTVLERYQVCSNSVPCRARLDAHAR